MQKRKFLVAGERFAYRPSTSNDVPNKHNANILAGWAEGVAIAIKRKRPRGINKYFEHLFTVCVSLGNVKATWCISDKMRPIPPSNRTALSKFFASTIGVAAHCAVSKNGNMGHIQIILAFRQSLQNEVNKNKHAETYYVSYGQIMTDVCTPKRLMEDFSSSARVARRTLCLLKSWEPNFTLYIVSIMHNMVLAENFALIRLVTNWVDKHATDVINVENLLNNAAGNGHIRILRFLYAKTTHWLKRMHLQPITIAAARGDYRTMKTAIRCVKQAYSIPATIRFQGALSYEMDVALCEAARGGHFLCMMLAKKHGASGFQTALEVANAPAQKLLLEWIGAA